jgi:predicted RNase H-like HicB family nuclease
MRADAPCPVFRQGTFSRDRYGTSVTQAVEWWPMSFDDYKVVLYRNQPDGWVAEIPAIPGCYALMPTREEALVELAVVFRLISEEYEERKQPLPADTTEIVHA